MAFTKIAAAGIGSTETVTLHSLEVLNNATVGGVLTYEDVTNVDSIGIVTARAGVLVGSGITLSKDGDVFFTGIITGNGSGLTNLATDLVNDTSPQLGGNLDVNTKNIVFGDSGGATDDRLTFGAGTDLSIYHDSNNSKITHNGAGGLYIGADTFALQKGDHSENYISMAADGAVELYHDNTKRFETTSYGALVTGNLKLGDNGKAVFGDGDDLEISHNGTDSIIADTGTGDLYIRGSNDIFFQKGDGSETFMTATDDAGINLYHNNVNKFSTQTYGIAVDGVVTFTKDADDDTTSTIQVNGSAMTSTDYNYLMSATNDSGSNFLTMFVNGSGRSSDGGANGLTIRNDNGPMNVGLNGSTHSTTYYTGLAGGIDFSGHGNAGGMNSELLDDYEEGTWTATLSDGETCTSAQTRYTKIGCLVTVNAYITNFSDFNGNSNGFRIAGLPFAGRNVSSYHGGGSISYAQNFNYSYPLLPLLAQGDSYIYFHRQDGTSSTWKYQDFHNTGNGSGGQLIVNFTYETA